jgi:hypothetical protein
MGLPLPQKLRVSAALLGVLSIITFALRCFVRLRIVKAWGRDDTCITLAFVRPHSHACIPFRRTYNPPDCTHVVYRNPVDRYSLRNRPTNFRNICGGFSTCHACKLTIVLKTCQWLTFYQVLVAMLPCIRMFNHIGQNFRWVLLPENRGQQIDFPYHDLHYHVARSYSRLRLLLSQHFPMHAGQLLLDTFTRRYQWSMCRHRNHHNSCIYLRSCDCRHRCSLGRLGRSTDLETATRSPHKDSYGAIPRPGVHVSNMTLSKNDLADTKIVQVMLHWFACPTSRHSRMQTFYVSAAHMHTHVLYSILTHLL